MTISWLTTLDTHTYAGLPPCNYHPGCYSCAAEEQQIPHCLCIHLNYDQLLSRCNTPTQRGHTAASSMDTSDAVVQALESVKDTRRLLLILIISSFSFFCFSRTACVPRPWGWRSTGGRFRSEGKFLCFCIERASCNKVWQLCFLNHDFKVKRGLPFFPWVCWLVCVLEHSNGYGGWG